MLDFQKDGAFLLHRPGRILAAQGPFRKSAAPPLREPALFVPDFFLEDPAPWRIATDWTELSLDQLPDRVRAPARDPEPVAWSGPQFETFAETFEDLKRQIAAGTLTKAVPVTFWEGRGEAPRTGLLPHLLESAARIAPPLVPYGYWDEEGGMVGATPEVLFHSTPGGEVHTMALAGTALNEGAGRLLEDPKERAEHRIVLEHILKALEPFGSIRCGDTEILCMPGVAHLKTDILMKLEAETPATFQDLVHALHPTPALGGAPRAESLAWLKAGDRNVHRGRFGAPFGYRGEDGSGLCLVAIRNVQWAGDALRIGAGAGVVAGSVLDREWWELNQKREAVMKILGP